MSRLRVKCVRGRSDAFGKEDAAFGLRRALWSEMCCSHGTGAIIRSSPWYGGGGEGGGGGGYLVALSNCII